MMNGPMGAGQGPFGPPPGMGPPNMNSVSKIEISIFCGDI